MKPETLGICLCGLNGNGKTTLAARLAARLGLYHMDIESYYFPDPSTAYADPRPREEALRLLRDDVRAHPRFVFSAVKGDMGEEITARYRLVVFLDAPLRVRMARIRRRAWERFGDRVLEGGDLWEREEAFFAFAASRTTDSIDAWLATLTCPVLRLDGEADLEDNLRRICERLDTL